MKTKLRFATFAAIAFTLSACGLSPEEKLERAVAAFEDNRFGEARIDLASLLQEDENNLAALELLARTQLQSGDGEGAVSTLMRLERLGASVGDFDTLMAEAQLLRGNYDEALAASTDLGTSEGSRIAALAYIGLGDVRGAQSAFELGLDQPGDSARLYADYAVFMLRAGDAAAADRLATRARAEDEEGLDPLIASGRIAQARGNLNEALSHYDAAVTHWPESRMARLGQIGVLGDLGRLDEARPLIEDMARRSPGDTDVTYLQARLAAEDADWDDVRDRLQAVEGDQDPRLQLLYARALIELDLPQQAMPRLLTLLRRNPANSEARRLLAGAQLETGDAAAAYSTIRPLAVSPTGSAQDLAIFAAAARATGRTANIGEALEASPPAERVANLLAQGDAALKQENWRDAIDAYEQLRAWTGNSNALVLNNLAYAHGRIGNVDEGIALGEEALQLAPDHASIMDTLGWMLVESGRNRSRGLLLLGRAAELDPENPAINRHLSEARGS